MNNSVKEIVEGFAEVDYILGEELATVLHISQVLEKPLLLEGEPGVGKTTVAIALSDYLKKPLLRLQCYEGLDANTSIYEWNYQKQILHIKLGEAQNQVEKLSSKIFGNEFLLKRPLLESITHPQKVVLLIDEIDRADEEFEAFLLELLSDFQISIPEIGTLKAKHKPFVILTSNRTRELSDALKRRCLYHWLDFPPSQKEIDIIRKKNPDLEESLAIQITTIIRNLRQGELTKQPGIAEAIDWAQTLLRLHCQKITQEIFAQTAGVILKTKEDIAYVKSQPLEVFLNPPNESDREFHTKEIYTGYTK